MLIYRCSAMGFCGGHGGDLGYIMSVAMNDIKIRWLNVDDVDEIRKSMLFLYTWTVESYLNCNFVLTQAASESLGFFSEPLSWQNVWAGSEQYSVASSFSSGWSEIFELQLMKTLSQKFESPWPSNILFSWEVKAQCTRIANVDSV